MAVAPLNLQGFSGVNNTVDPSQWSSLGNLGNVYRDATAAAAKRAALASLGTDPAANERILLTSGDPALAQLGLSQQQKDIERADAAARYKVTDARADAELALRRAENARAQGNYEQADADRKQAAAILATLPGGGQGQAGGAPSFPAPLPGTPPVAAPQAPPLQAAPPQAPPQAVPPVEPSAFGATPPAPAGFQPTAAPSASAPITPPIKAQDDEPTTPAWAQDPGGIAGRMAANLTSPHPTAAAGISREQLGAMYANPLTRPLASAFLQKQLDPGAWTYHFDAESGRVIGTNSLDPTKTRDVTPPTATGAAPTSKQEREMQGYYQGAKAQGYSDEQAHAIAVNKGKLPSEDLHPDERKQIFDLTSQAQTGQRVIENINELRQISKKAWGYPGAQKMAENVAGYLPSAITPQGAIETQDLTNAARTNVTNLAKSIFGARITNVDIKLLEELEGSANQPDAVRQRIFTRAENMIKTKIEQAKSEAEGIRNKTYYKPGGGEAPTATAAPAARPSLGAIFGGK